MTRILQCNLNRCTLAQNLLRQRVFEDKIDVCFISEQHINLHGRSWFADETGTAALWIVNTEKVTIINTGRGAGFVWIHTPTTYFMSVYLSPNEGISVFRQKLANIENAMDGFNGEIIIAGDFNAKSAEWGATFSDTRGNEVSDVAARRDLIVLNTGNASTFRRPGYQESVLDITLATPGIANMIEGWTVSEEYSGSDHQHVTFSIGRVPILGSRHDHQPRKWNARKLDIEALRTFLARESSALQSSPTPSTRSEAEATASRAMRLIVTACNASMPRLRKQGFHRPAYWWSQEIAELRKTCHKLRRRATRAAKRLPDQDKYAAEYKQAKKVLNKAIKSSKAELWKEICNDLNNDLWGKAYQIVTKRLGKASPEAPKSPDVMNGIVAELFPKHPQREKRQYVASSEKTSFTIKELQDAAKTIKTGKAPGPDGIPASVIKTIALEFPHILLSVYNACLATGMFPAVWKRQRLVLIDKGKGTPITPSSFRPLCMLDIAGKLLEKLIQGRLRDDINRAGGFATNQHGFRKGRSTIGAIQKVIKTAREAWSGSLKARKVCLLLTFDVKNAFNSANWEDILDALEHRFEVKTENLEMIDDYLDKRKLIVETTEGPQEYGVTAGVPQGSIMGADLWNANYDELLRIPLPNQVELTGFADDVAATIVVDSVEEAEWLVRETTDAIETWLEKHHLKLAKQKTEMVVLTRQKWFPKPFVVDTGETTLTSTRALRYLGVVIDENLSFREHLENACTKANKTVSSISRIMTNTMGPRTKKRRVLLETVHSVLLYGAEIWADILKQKTYRRKIATIQRRGALRVACAYRTVSEAAVLVIAGAAPIDLLAFERAKLYDAKISGDNLEEAITRIKKETLQEWQDRWTSGETGRWTERLIPNINFWLSRKHGDTDFFLTQLLTGHGQFNAYLFKMGLHSTPTCKYCSDKIDDAEHTFFECARWKDYRSSTEEIIGARLSPSSLVTSMVKHEGTWSAVATYAQQLLKDKITERDQ